MHEGEVSKKFHSNECRRINYYQQMCLSRAKHPTAFVLLRSFSFFFSFFSFVVEEGRCWSLILTQRFIKNNDLSPSKSMPCNIFGAPLSPPPSTLHCKCHRSTGTSGGETWLLTYIARRKMSLRALLHFAALIIQKDPHPPIPP